MPEKSFGRSYKARPPLVSDIRRNTNGTNPTLVVCGVILAFSPNSAVQTHIHIAMQNKRQIAVHFAVWIMIGAAFMAILNWAIKKPVVITAEGTGTVLTIPRSQDGHYYLEGAINGQPVRFMVDTGASLVSVGGALAAKLSLPRGAPAMFHTAGGETQGEIVRNQSVSINGLTIGKLSIGVNTRAGDMALLGQNFLKHVPFMQEGNQLQLRFVSNATISPESSPGTLALFTLGGLLALAALVRFMVLRQEAKAKLKTPAEGVFGIRPDKPSAYARLLLACGGDFQRVARLIGFEKSKAPSIDTKEATKRALERLYRDRQ